MKRKMIAMFLSLAMIATSFSMPVMAEEVVEDAVLIETVQDASELIEKIEKISDDENLSAEEEKVDEISEGEADKAEEIVEETTDITKEDNTKNNKEYYYRYDEWEEDGEIYYEDYWNVPSIHIGDAFYYYCDIHNNYLDTDPEISDESNRAELKEHICDSDSIVTNEEIASAAGVSRVEYIPRETDKYTPKAEMGTWKVCLNNDSVTGGISTEENLDIIISGENVISQEFEGDEDIWFLNSTLSAGGDLTIEGDGKLAVSIPVINEWDDRWYWKSISAIKGENIYVKNKAKVSARVDSDFSFTEVDVAQLYNDSLYCDATYFLDRLESEYYRAYSSVSGWDDDSSLLIDKGCALKIEKSPLSIVVDPNNIKKENEDGKYERYIPRTIFKNLNSIDIENVKVEGTLEAYSVDCKDIELNSPDKIKLTKINAEKWVDDDESDEYHNAGSVKMTGVEWTEANGDYLSAGGIRINTQDLIISNSTLGTEDNDGDYIGVNNKVYFDENNADSKLYAKISAKKIILDSGKVYAYSEDDWTTINEYDDEVLNILINGGELTVKANGDNSAICNAEMIIPDNYKIVEGSASMAADTRIVNRNHRKSFIHICGDVNCEEVLNAIANKDNWTIKIGDDITITEGEGPVSGDGWSYDRATETLTLKNFERTNNYSFTAKDIWGDSITACAAIYASNDININVIGENTITATNNAADYKGIIYSEGNINISGSGTINVPYDEDGGRIDEVLYSNGDLMLDGVKISDEVIEDVEDDLGFKVYASDAAMIKNADMKLRAVQAYNIILDNAKLRGMQGISTKEAYNDEDECYISEKLIINNSTINGAEDGFIGARSVEINSSDLIFDGYSIVDKSLKIADSTVDTGSIYMDYSDYRNSSISIDNSNVKVSGYGVVVEYCKKIDFKSGRLEVTAIGDGGKQPGIRKAFEPLPEFNIAKGYGIITNTESQVVIDKVSETFNNEISKSIELKDKNGNPISAKITVNTTVMDRSGKEVELPVKVDLNDCIKVDTKKNVVTFTKAKDMPKADGYTFKGWFTKESGMYKKVSKIPAKKLKDMTVSAVYTENEYKLSYKLDKPVAGAKVNGKAQKAQKVKYSEKIKLDATEITATDKSGKTYKLVGWSETRGAKTADYKLGEEKSKLAGKDKKNKKIVLYSVWE